MLLLGQHVQLLFEVAKAGGAVVAAALCALTCINAKSPVVKVSLGATVEAEAAGVDLGLGPPGGGPPRD